MTMESYQKMLDQESTLILTTGSDIFKFLKNVDQTDDYAAAKRNAEHNADAKKAADDDSVAKEKVDDTDPKKAGDDAAAKKKVEDEAAGENQG